MTRYWREVPRADLEIVSRTLQSWHYVRPVPLEELERAFVVGLLDTENEDVEALAWLVQGPEPDALAVHACRAPESQVEIGTAENLEGLKALAEVLGACRLYSHLPAAFAQSRPDIPIRAMRRYFRARGWKEDEHGPYVALGR